MNKTERQDRITMLYANKNKRQDTFKKQAISDYSSVNKNASEALKIDLVNIPKLKKELFPFQKEGISFLIAKNGRAIIGDDPGLGKTIQAIGYCQYESNCRPVLVIAPSFLKINWALEILSWMENHDNNKVFLLSGKTNKFIEEASLKGSGRIQLTPCKKLPKEGIFIINYDILDDWKASLPIPKIVVIDECFIAGTLIDTPEGLKAIETIKVGDVVYNATGIGIVKNVFCKKSQNIITLHLSNDTTISCTPEHPLFTTEGWCIAKDSLGKKLLQSTRSSNTKQKEIGYSEYLRVERITIYKPTNSGRCSESGERGGMVYNLEVSGHPSYFVNSILVHNCHKIKNKKAIRTKATMVICSKAEKIISLTGTLIDSKPAEAFNVIKMIDPVLFKSEWLFKQRYCDPKHNGFGWSFDGATNVEELHEKLKTICIRRKKENVLKDLPSKMRIVVPIEMDNMAEYQQAERNVIDYIKRTKGKGAAEKASYAETLARLNILKQLTIKGKLEGCLSWIENYLATGEKLVVFCTHTATLNTIYEAFKEWSVKVDGSVKNEDRNDAVNQFQNNKKIRLFVGNIQAAGVGLTLTKAAATCTIELSWNPSEHTQAEDRIHRIGQEADHVFAYYLLAANSIELDIAELIDRKQKIVDAVLDGKSIEGSISLVNELLNKLKGD